MLKRHICIHAHFYQPPRENAWLEDVERQDSAYPYHDWNERITAECYARNAASRILNNEGWIEAIVNNYARISFNLGPTLMAWLAVHAPDVHEAILEADRQSLKIYDGHGSALAQAYNHMIMPLANDRDKRTQVRWGIADFVHRFKRRPEGMWLPETAVDIASLEALAAEGIAFTILAPHQAGRVRPLPVGKDGKGGGDDGGDQDWRDVSNSDIDITMPYAQKLPSGRSINLFFYDGPISRAVAFEGILNSGETFAGRLMDGFVDRDGPQLVHIATDGESYGHHHSHGDMALAYALHTIAENDAVELINYSAFLERYPPTHEVQIIENTSWSCVHGIERWRGDCGCNSGGYPQWNQQWRAPLRQSLDWLRDALAPDFEKQAATDLKDPWAARDDYIEVVLDRSDESLGRFLSRHATRQPDLIDIRRVSRLLEIQRQALLMYTSCGWFFDELSGLETVQVIQYAGRAIQLGGEVLEPGFLDILQQARSNIPDIGDGRKIYDNFVRPAMVDLYKVAAHWAISSLFESYEDKTVIYCYQVDRRAYRSGDAGRAKLAAGVIVVTSLITRETAEVDFGALHMGDHNINCGIRPHADGDTDEAFVREAFDAFDIADFPEVIRTLDRHFPEHRSSLTTLFRDEQRAVLAQILQATLEIIEGNYRQIYNNHAPLIRFLKTANNPTPKSLYIAGEVVINRELEAAFQAPELDMEAIDGLLSEARLAGIALDDKTLEYTFRKRLEADAHRMLSKTDGIRAMDELMAGLKLADALPFPVEVAKVQDICGRTRTLLYDKMAEQAESGDALAWRDSFQALCEKLNLRIIPRD